MVIGIIEDDELLKKALDTTLKKRKRLNLG